MEIPRRSIDHKLQIKKKVEQKSVKVLDSAMGR